METITPNLVILTQLRKELHKHPEISGKEFHTAKRIITFLENYAADEIITNVGKTGIIAIYNGQKAGQTILFRSELDALPIQETNSFEHQSIYKGISHKCGHDGHIAILCGLAVALHHNRPETGKVILLFQPAEEDGSGAKMIYNDPKFVFKPDFVFALHNLPGYPLNQVIVKNNTFTCAVNSIIIQLKGKTAHAGEPEKGINPALAIAAIITAFNKIVQPIISKKNYCLITPIYCKMGKKAYGVAAGDGEIHFTVRSDSNSQMRKIEALLENTIEEIATLYSLNSTLKWTESFQANENNSIAVNHIREAAKTKQFELVEKETPFTWGEDFGLFTQQYKGAMFGLGSGTNMPALHNPDYDFPDEIMPTGIALFHQISKQILNAT